MTEESQWGRMLQDEIRDGFARFAGTSLQGVLQVPGSWLNGALKEAVQAGRTAPVTGLSVALLENNRAVLLVALDRFPLPRKVELPVQVVPRSADPSCATLELLLEPSGWLRLLLPMIAPLANGQGIQLDGNRLRLRLADLLDSPDLPPLLAPVQELAWGTATGMLRIAFSWCLPGIPGDKPVDESAMLPDVDSAREPRTRLSEGLETDQTQVPRLNLAGTLCVSESLVGEVLAGLGRGVASLAHSTSEKRGSGAPDIEHLDLGPVRLDAGRACIGIRAAVRKPV